MKSEKAKEFIIQYSAPPLPTAAFSTIPATTTAALFELAEEDARERAVKAFVSGCSHNHFNGLCYCEFHTKSCDLKCKPLDKFLKIYDNDKNEEK